MHERMKELIDILEPVKGYEGPKYTSEEIATYLKEKYVVMYEVYFIHLTAGPNLAEVLNELDEDAHITAISGKDDIMISDLLNKFIEERKLQAIIRQLVLAIEKDPENMVTSGRQFASAEEYVLETMIEYAEMEDAGRTLEEFFMKNLNLNDYSIAATVIHDWEDIENILTTMIMNINNAVDGPDY